MRSLVRCVVVVVVLVAVAPYAGAAAPRIEAARRGAGWIASQQQEDGGFFTPGQRVDQTAEALASFIAGGGSGHSVERALGHIRREGPAASSRGAFTGRIVAALVAAGEDAQSFGGTDYVSRLIDQYDKRSGAFDTENLFSNLQGANGALAAGIRLPDEALERISAHACEAGGFGYENRCAKGPDTDTTAWAINVLVAAGRRNDPQVASARTFLLSVQQADGGFGFTRDKATSADSTGLVLSAIEALGEKATAPPWEQSDGDHPVKALLKLQDDDGSFRFVASSRAGNALSTTNAVPGLASVAYPVPRASAQAARGGTTPAPAPAARGDGVSGARAPGAAAGTAPSSTPTPSGSPSAGPSSSAAAPFAQTAAEDAGDGGLPAFALWGGLAAIAGLAGGGAWWLSRRSAGA